MPAPDNAKIQFNFKTPKGSLLNLYATSEAEMEQLIASLESFAPQIAGLEATLNGVSNAAPIAAPATEQAPVDAPVAPWDQPSNPIPQTYSPATSAIPPDLTQQGGGIPGAPTCLHGPRTYREGVSPKSGKPYKAWFCSGQDRNTQCPAEWVR